MTDSATTAAVFTPTHAGERFGADVATHRLAVLHDDGLYRHLRFRRWLDADPEKNRPASWSSSYWFDLITWPGSLAVNGDMGAHVFAREDDMFGFFRGSRINPGYWAEKLRTPSPESVTTYSEKAFHDHVMEVAREAEIDYPGVTASIQERLFGCMAEWNTEVEEGAREALRDFTYAPEDAAGVPFQFPDAWWEWSLRDWDFRFLWNCHAIQWGIARYDEARRSTQAVAADA